MERATYMSVALLCMLASVIVVSGGRVEDVDLANSNIISNVKNVFTEDDCTGLCEATTDCVSAVFSIGGSACKLLNSTHEDPGVVFYTSLNRVYLFDGVAGCSHPSATNYNSSTTLAIDADCQFDAADVLGCMDSTALNYAANATVEFQSPCTYRLTYTKWNGYQLKGATSIMNSVSGEPWYRRSTIEECMELCMNTTGCQSVNQRTDIPRCFLMEEKKDDGSEARFTTSISFTHASIGFSGCDDSFASNYDSEAIYDDGSCTYDPSVVFGCLDPLAVNYDTTVHVHDSSSCDYVGTWVQQDDTRFVGANVLLRYGRPEMINNDFAWCRSQCESHGACYAFNFQDLQWCQLFSSYDLAEVLPHTGMEFWRNPDYFGCTNSEATNFNSVSVEDDDSCSFDASIVVGCMDSTAYNYDVNATIHDQDLCVYDTMWNVVINVRYTRDPVILKVVRPEAMVYDHMRYCRDQCLNTSGCGGFNFKEAFHCHLFGVVDTSIDAFGYNGTQSHDGWMLWTRKYTDGCTDVRATNYDDFAIVNNGSCTWPPGSVVGCSDTAANNYDSSVTIDLNDELCDYSVQYIRYNETVYLGTGSTSSASAAPGDVDGAFAHCSTACDAATSCIAFNSEPGQHCQLFSTYTVTVDSWGVHGLAEDASTTVGVHPDHEVPLP